CQCVRERRVWPPFWQCCSSEISHPSPESPLSTTNFSSAPLRRCNPLFHLSFLLTPSLYVCSPTLSLSLALSLFCTLPDQPFASLLSLSLSFSSFFFSLSLSCCHQHTHAAHTHVLI